MPAADTDDPERIDDTVALVRRMPDRARRFHVGPDLAGTEYGLGPDLLGRLVAAGLPRLDSPAGPRYDRTDLLNVALNLDTGSRARRVLAWWARELERGGPAAYRLSYVTGCPDPTHRGPCRYTLRRPGGGTAVLTGTPHPPRQVDAVTVRLPTRWPRPTGALADLLDGLPAIRFVRLPDPIRWDVDFMLESGVGDCCAVAAYLVRTARQRGMRARLSYGRSLTPPFTSAHYWAEVDVEGIWVPVDPVFIDALLGWGLLDAGRWNRHSSLGAILVRLAGGPADVAVHNGVPVPVRLPAYHHRPGG